MKKLMALLAAALLLAGCSSSGSGDATSQTLTVAATAVPHAEILKEVKPILAKEGVNLEIKVFADYVQPNVQVDEKSIDVNYFQTKPYLDAFNRERKTNLIISKARLLLLGSLGIATVAPSGNWSMDLSLCEYAPNGSMCTPVMMIRLVLRSRLKASR